MRVLVVEDDRAIRALVRDVLQGGGDVHVAPQENAQIVDAFKQKLIKNAQKYPIEKAKGVSTKYTGTFTRRDASTAARISSSCVS